MDQKKTGYFLKQLRNEKKLTQEQLAEKFQITSRTVSRWETGSNMPDISMLLELADFYEVDIREIIDGERKSEQMNEELKETVIKVTDYTETNNARLLKRVRIIGITGVITILIAMVMDAGGLAVSPFWESVKRDLYAWTLGTLIANILYTTGWLKRISEKKDVSRTMRISGVVCAVIRSAYMITRPLRFLAARPTVCVSERCERRKPSLSASSMATNETSGKSNPSRKRLTPISTS